MDQVRCPFSDQRCKVVGQANAEFRGLHLGRCGHFFLESEAESYPNQKLFDNCINKWSIHGRLGIYLLGEKALMRKMFFERKIRMVLGEL